MLNRCNVIGNINAIGRKVIKSILNYKIDFDILYYPVSDYIIQSNGIISELSDVNNNNKITQSTESLKPSVNSNKSITLSQYQLLVGASADRSNFDLGTNDLYVILGVRTSKFSQGGTIGWFSGGGTTTIGGYSFYITDPNKTDNSFIYYFSIHDGTTWKSLNGKLTTDLFDDKFHIIEILLDRDVGSSIYIDGVLQTGLNDNTSDLDGQNINLAQDFVINSTATNLGRGNNIINCLGIIKNLPTEAKRNTYRNVISSPYNDFRLNPYLIYNPNVDSRFDIHLISNESYTIYGDAVFNIPVDTDFNLNYVSVIGSQSGNNFNINSALTTRNAIRYTIEVNNQIIDSNYGGVKLNTKVASGTKKILMVGDSTMTGGAKYYFDKLISIFSGLTLTSLGTQSTDGVNHEGYSGKTYKWLVDDVNSPFTKAGVLDISAYFTDNVIDTPDIVYLRMGINDIYNESNDDMTKTELFLLIDDITELVDGFLSYDANLKIIVALPSICTNSSSIWDLVYPSYPYQDKYIELMHYFWNEIISRYSGGVYNSRVDVSRGAMFLDRTNGYPSNNAVHMNQSGYEQIANGDAGAFNKLF
jgi:hypothetical protein